VLRSTGFEPFRVREHPVPQGLQPIIDATLPAYLELLEHRIAST
jgi:hypothetical protein